MPFKYEKSNDAKVMFCDCSGVPTSYNIDIPSFSINGSIDLEGFITHTNKRKSAIEIERVIFHNPATIIFWSDGMKTVVKCSKDDKYDRLTGFLLCVMKKAYGNKGRYNNVIREFCPIDICEGGDA